MPLSPWEAPKHGALEKHENWTNESLTTSSEINDSLTPVPYDLRFTSSTLKSPMNKSAIKRTPLAEVSKNILARANSTSNERPPTVTKKLQGVGLDGRSVSVLKNAVEVPDLINLDTPIQDVALAVERASGCGKTLIPERTANLSSIITSGSFISEPGATSVLPQLESIHNFDAAQADILSENEDDLNVIADEQPIDLSNSITSGMVVDDFKTDDIQSDETMVMYGRHSKEAPVPSNKRVSLRTEENVEEIGCDRLAASTAVTDDIEGNLRMLPLSPIYVSQEGMKDTIKGAKWDKENQNNTPERIKDVCNSTENENGIASFPLLEGDTSSGEDDAVSAVGANATLNGLASYQSSSTSLLSTAANDQCSTNPVVIAINVAESESRIIDEPVRLQINVLPLESESSIEGVFDAENSRSSNKIETLESENEQLVMEVAQLDIENERLKKELEIQRAEQRDRSRELSEAKDQIAALNSRVSEAESIPAGTPPTTRITIQQLREELAREKTRNQLLEARLKGFQAADEVKELEHASLMEFLALEKTILTEEISRRDECAQKAETLANEAAEKAVKYDNDRMAAASNLNKAEREVDLLAEEVEALTRRLHYVSGRLMSEITLLESYAPSTARLAKELSSMMKSGAPSASLPLPNTENQIGRPWAIEEDGDDITLTHSITLNAPGFMLVQEHSNNLATCQNDLNHSRMNTKTPALSLKSLPPLPKSAFKARQRN